MVVVVVVVVLYVVVPLETLSGFCLCFVLLVVRFRSSLSPDDDVTSALDVAVVAIRFVAVIVAVVVTALFKLVFVVFVAAAVVEIVVLKVFVRFKLTHFYVGRLKQNL